MTRRPSVPAGATAAFPARGPRGRIAGAGALFLALAGAVLGAGNIVNQTWRLHSGDDPRWASPAYPVSNWRDYNLGVSHERQCIDAETFWLRQTFRVPESWQAEPLRGELRILAREVALYLNGEKLPLESGADRSASFVVPTALLRNGGAENHFALRISGHDYTGGAGTDFVRLRPENRTVPTVALSLAFPTRDHVFEPGAAVRFGLSGTLSGSATARGTLRIRIENEFHRVMFVESRDVVLAAERASLGYTPPALPPGFYQVVASYSAPEIEAQEIQWFAVAPTELQCAPTAPADLAEYWTRAKAELAAVPPAFSVQLDESRSTARHQVYTVSMNSVEGVTLRAWYIVPRRPGAFPAVLHLPGYGGSFQPEWFMADDDIAHLALEVRGHGRSAEQINPGFGVPGYVGYRVLEPERYVYRGAYLDGVRAVDFLCSRPEIDASRVAVDGASQGGGLAIATTALSGGRVKCCTTAVPFLGDFLHHQQMRAIYISEMEAALKAAGRGSFADVIHTMSYVDTVNLAPWIRCPVLMASGLFDDDCPSHINFAAYNRLSGPKEYRVYPQRPHDVGAEWGVEARAWLRRQFGLPEGR